MNKLKLYLDGNTINYITDNLDFQETSLNECDYILSSKFDFGIYDYKPIQNILNTYTNINKTVIIFLITDSTDKFNIPKNVLLFRTSLYKSIQSKNEYLLPYVWEKIDKPFHILKKTEKPIIGFCGKVDNYRVHLIKALQKRTDLTINFIIRQNFWGGAPNDPKLFDQFTDNIINSHFTVCNRGRGNFSMRFYQTLSAGRIPILIDTDMVFPFEKEIDWHSIIIIGSCENDVINKILDWWNNRNIEDIQVKCKEVYDSFFDKKKYFNKIFYDIMKDNIYGLYYDLLNMNKNQLIEHYEKYGKHEGRLTKLPDNFDINIYREKNEDLLLLNDKELLKHFVNHGYYEKRCYSFDINN